MATIFCDEAGNSGENLLDRDQPFFVLASNDFDEAEANALLRHIRSHQGGEPKFSTLRKTESGIRRVLALLNDPLLSKERTVVDLFDKRFMVITKMVDLIVESLMHESGGDLYEGGANIAMSNMLSACMPVFCGEAETDALLRAFVQLIRTRTTADAAAYYEAAGALMASCKDNQFAETLTPITHPLFFREWFDSIGALALDPAIPALFEHVVEWGKRKKERFDIIHDKSKPILASSGMFHSMMAKAEEQIATIGYDRRKFDFPLKATSLQNGDSKAIPQLQVADVCAGCVNHFAKCRQVGAHDLLSDGIRDAGCLDWVINAVLPGSEVTPVSLGTVPDGGSNPVDSMLLRRRRGGL